MEGEVTPQTGMDNGEMIFIVSFEGGIDGFHTQIETDDKVVEIQTQTQSITHRQILQDALQLELSARLLGIVTQRPDITCIDKQGTAEFPEQVGTVFEVQVEFQVTGLGDEVDITVLVAIAPRAKLRTLHPRTLLAPPEK